MALTSQAAARKDRVNATGTTFEHRHFAAIAGILKGMQHDPALTREELTWVIERFALELATTNPRFDRARFLAACGVQD